jgi:hypothetical protein
MSGGRADWTTFYAATKFPAGDPNVKRSARPGRRTAGGAGAPGQHAPPRRGASRREQRNLGRARGAASFETSPVRAPCGGSAGGVRVRHPTERGSARDLTPREESATSSRGDAVETCTTPPRGRETCATPQRGRAGIARSAAQGEPM